MLFHGKLRVRPTLTVPLFALFGSKGFRSYAIEMFGHAHITPDSENGSNGAGDVGITKRLVLRSNQIHRREVAAIAPDIASQ